MIQAVCAGWKDIKAIVAYYAPLDVSSFCHEFLFSPMRSVILCSATLTSSNDFSYAKERLGLTSHTLSEHIYSSPFDFASRSLFLVPTDLPFPHEPSYLSQALFTMERAIDISKGSVFVL